VDVVVLGGGGLTGRCAVWDLAESGVFDSVRVADLDGGLAEQAARKAPKGANVSAHAVDVRDRTALVNLLKGARVCVNAVQYNLNLDVMEGCLSAGVEYLDFGGLFHTTKKQLMLHGRFLKAGLLAVPGMGQVPGISNILAAAACADLDAVDSIVVRDGWKDFTLGAPPVVFTWSPSTFLDEMVFPAVVWQNGEYRELPAMSGGEEYDFPEPIGRTRVYRTLHSEPATLPDSFRSKGLQHCEWREGGPGIDVLQLLATLGLASDRPLEIRGHPVAPKEVLLGVLKREKLLGYPEGVQVEDREIVDVEVQGRAGSSAITRHAYAAFRSKPEWGVAATEIAVGVCGSVAAILIAQGKSTGKGVVPPELSMPPSPFLDMLDERGVVTRICPPEPPLRFTDNKVWE
jgi:saccharopine dehydrogenase-like NADP-dependent oxidoreductase